MTTILCGTAGWADKSLIACKRFYPRGCSTAQARLAYYASIFPLVEVDSSYYALPSRTNSELWAERTPENFVFNLKAFRLLTGHQTGREALPPDIAIHIPETSKKNLYYRDFPPEIIDEVWRRFFDAFGPLDRAGKLGAVLFQFPPWLTSSPQGRAHVQACVERMSGHTMAIEFRNPSWLDDKHKSWTLGFERENGITHVVMDAPPDVTTRAQTVWEATNENLAIVRLHGRNAQTWNATGASASGRFNYDYTDDELLELSIPIRTLARQVTTTHVIFNNCFEDQGQRNGQSMMKLLQAQP
ncbi:DUF72 domain-containing protein [Trinickia dabaoshanensis]|uniref:DUF72 domain-containing protein n=1 Tax=Trinickia dabaoshanensis TaxID=564714 RepID=A0A2N7VX64_9BURK|nr:DUF72 domain-containing protein [Trinickia dabaoshanensis]PMS21733.1 DUF72 domain-containing protein [Trinickia dabaoshanensis]